MYQNENVKVQWINRQTTQPTHTVVNAQIKSHAETPWLFVSRTIPSPTNLHTVTHIYIFRIDNLFIANVYTHHIHFRMQST